jgi:hypothetical protein
MPREKRCPAREKSRRAARHGFAAAQIAAIATAIIAADCLHCCSSPAKFFFITTRVAVVVRQ